MTFYVEETHFNNIKISKLKVKRWKGLTMQRLIKQKKMLE